MRSSHVCHGDTCGTRTWQQDTWGSPGEPEEGRSSGTCLGEEDQRKVTIVCIILYIVVDVIYLIGDNIFLRNPLGGNCVTPGPSS